MALLINKMLCHYRYDATDRLVGHLESEALERRLFYCGSRQVTEMQGLSNRTTILHGKLLLAQHSNENIKRNTALLTTDQQCSVINALQSQKPPSPSVYTPYGHRTIGTDVASLPSFTGERADPVTQHYPLGQGHRWFNPVLMRFNSPDSLSPFGRGGLNSYVYCMGDPVNQTDPSGKFSVRSIWAAARGKYIKEGVTFDLQQVKNVKQIAPTILIYDDTYKNGTRLNISAHGQAPDPTNGTSSGMQYSKESAINPMQLYQILKKNNVEIKKYDSIRLISCNLADGNISFAGEFAILTGKQVKAYSGKLMALHFNDSTWGALSPSETILGIAKRNHYEPRYFYPWNISQKIRQPER